MFFKKKRLQAVKERTADTIAFEIPQIKTKEEKNTYKKNHFVSPIFGENVKDEIVIPTPYKRTGDLDKQFDNFRTEPKLTKEERIRKYGSEFPEFDVVSGKSLREAMDKNKTKKEKVKFEEERITNIFNSERSFNPGLEEAEVKKEKLKSKKKLLKKKSRLLKNL